MAKSIGDLERELPWNEEMVRRFGLAAKTARGQRSAQWLSDRTAALGQRVSPTVIAKLDSGHRGSVLQVWEMVVIAAALEVPPLSLLYPDQMGGPVDWLPGRTVISARPVRWFVGDEVEQDDGKLDGYDMARLREDESVEVRRRRRKSHPLRVARQYLWDREYQQLLRMRIEKARAEGNEIRVAEQTERLNSTEDVMDKHVAWLEQYEMNKNETVPGGD